MLHFCLDLLRVAIWRKLPMLCRSLGFSGTQEYPCLHFLWLGWHGPLRPLIALSWRRAKKTWRHRRLRLRGPDVAFILHLSFLCHGWCSWLTPTRIYNVSKCKNIGPKANAQGPFVFVFLYLGCSPPHRTTCHSPAPHVYSLFLFKYHDMHVFGVSASRSATLSYVFWLDMGMGWGGVGDDVVPCTLIHLWCYGQLGWGGVGWGWGWCRSLHINTSLMLRTTGVGWGWGWCLTSRECLYWWSLTRVFGCHWVRLVKCWHRTTRRRSGRSSGFETLQVRSLSPSQVRLISAPSPAQDKSDVGNHSSPLQSI